jgi:hypothetical protein
MTARTSRCVTIILAGLVLEDAERRGLGFREEMSRKPGARPLGWRISMAILARERKSLAGGLELSYRT